MSNANLLDAMVAYLRATPAVVSAFGDNPATPATDKFWATPVRTGVQIPWAVYEDGGGDVMWMTGAARPSIETSSIRFAVVGDGKDKALSLARLLADTLTDPPLEFDDGLLMYLRPGSPSVIPVGDLAPNTPNAYAYSIVFSTMVQNL